MSILLALGLILAVGFIGGTISRRVNLPTITGYVVVGLLLGPTVSGAVEAQAVVSLDWVTGLSLGVIAYLIGASLRMDTIRSLGKSIAAITVFEAVGAFIAVTVVLSFVTGRFLPGFSLRETYVPFALVMAAAACPTAPAAALAIVREYRAKGPLTTTLLAVVALDDAVAVIIFSGATAAALALAGTAGVTSTVAVIARPVLHIGEAIAVGAAFSLGISLLSRVVRTRDMMLVLVLGTVILCYAVCESIGVSGIMGNMTLGFVVGNRRELGRLVTAVADVEPVLYALFFVVAGLHFDSTTFAAAGPLAAVIVVVRIAGKYAGTRIGAVVGQAQPQVGKYLGMALLPEAGVSIGLALIAADAFPTLAATMVSATLASVIINELITPPLLRSALVKAGEVRRETPKDEAQPAESAEQQGSSNGTVAPIEGTSGGTSDSYVLESPWTRSQRARRRPPRDRGTGLTHPRPHL
jgi:Kef-type K+ transport system membrane component KefB